MLKQTRSIVVEQEVTENPSSDRAVRYHDMHSHSNSRSSTYPSTSCLNGKRMAMVTFSPYPVDPRMRRAAEALHEQGMGVDLICLRTGEEPAREASGGIDILRLSISHRRDSKLAYIYNYSAFILMATAVLTWRSIKRRYDFVYIHNMPDILILSALIPKALGAKVLLDLRDPMPELMVTIFGLDKDSFAVRLVRWLEKWSMARAHSVVTVNIACKEIFAARSCPREKIGVVMNSPDEQIFSVRSPLSYPRTNEIPANRFVIMYHGSVIERNGLDLAVAAVARVRQAVPSAELRIYGFRTPFLDEVMEDVRRKGLEDCVHYLGFRTLEELSREITTCDVGIIPNQRNMFTEINTPTRIFEYLAMGKPVIAPCTRGVQDYFDPHALVFFEPGNVEELAQKLEYVAFHYNDAIAIAERGQRAYLRHAWSQERQTLLGLVSRLFTGANPC